MDRCYKKKNVGILGNTREFVENTSFQVSIRRSDDLSGAFASIYYDSLFLGKPVDTEGHVDYVPTLFTYMRQLLSVIKRREECQNRLEKRR